MKPIRLVILGTALVAGVGAAIMIASPKPPEAPRLTIIHAPVATDDVLVASKPLERGDVIEKGDLMWKGWPRDDVPPNAIRRSSVPTALSDYTGRFVNNRLFAEMPIVQDDIVQGNSFLAATLPSGMRAVAINIDQQGAQTAGGFIHEGDRVDVIHTYRDEDAAKAGVPNPMVSETILRNIKVLAIGPNTQDPKSEKVVFGSNATLELTPQQVETIVLAQRIGQLSLSLRSLADSKGPGVSDDDSLKPTGMTIVRYGIPIQAQSH